MPEEVWVKRCGEELDEIQDLIEKYSKLRADYIIYDHNCQVHDIRDACEAIPDTLSSGREIAVSLSKAFDDLSKCLGRIPHE